MKKFLLTMLSCLLLASAVHAATDISDNYWAKKEIDAVIKEGIITVYADGTFKPEKTVQRAEFNSMLLRTLGHPKANVNIRNKFTDVASDYWAYNDILKSEQLGLIYGYPNKTFKPEKIVTKSEAASIISHITKTDAVANPCEYLKNFTDGKDVKAWVKSQYAKTIKLNIYVNYPNENQLLPNKDLNRAEAAVLLYKLRQALGLVQDKYVAKEYVTGTEHLNIYKDAANNEVTVTNLRNIILKGNVLKAYFETDFNSKKYEVGEPVNFTFKEDVYTKEGTLLIPKGSTLRAVVETLDPQKIFNQNAEVTVSFNQLTLRNGATIPVSGRVLDNDGILTASKLATIGKVAGYTAGGAAIGAGAGVGFAAIPKRKRYGTGVAIGCPVGAGVGLITGLVTPGLAYKADENDALYIELTQNVSIGK